MARRKKADDGGSNAGAWLNTYADMVTLLLTFFILLFSMSKMDSTKFNMLVKAFASDIDSSEKIVIQGEGPEDKPSGVPVPGSPMDSQQIENLDDIFEALQEYIKANNLQESVLVDKGEDYVFIRFMDNMLFEPNSARLKPSDLEILNFVGYGIKSVEHMAEVVRIDGHTAAIPEDPNYAVSDRRLSSDRANAVLMHFEDVIGVNPTLLLQVGFGKWVPLNENKTEEEKQKNRRVEILISGRNLITEELEIIYEKLVD